MGQRRPRVYCACHEICTSGSPSAAPATNSTRQAAAGQRRPRVHPVLLQAHCRLCVLRLPRTLHSLQVHEVLCTRRNLHSRFTKCCACHEIYAATGQRRPRVHPSSCRLCVLRLPRTLRSRFMKCCACGEICTPASPSAVPATKLTAPATKSALQVHPVLRLPRNLHDRPCVVRLPRKLRSRFMKCCACGEICTPGGVR